MRNLKVNGNKSLMQLSEVSFLSCTSVVMTTGLVAVLPTQVVQRGAAILQIQHNEKC